MATKYRRNASPTNSNWGTDNNWSTTSTTGTANTTAPTSSDDVVFDVNSLATTLSAAGACGSLTFTGFTGTFTHGAFNLDIYGSLTVASGMTYTISNGISSTITFKATATGKTITSAGKTLPSMTFDGVGGGWTLQDALTITSNWIFQLTNGNLNTNGKTVTAGYFFSNVTNTRTLTLGFTTFNLAGTSFLGSGAWYVNSTNLTLSAGSSTINLTGTTNADISISFGSTQTYNTVSMTNKATYKHTLLLSGCTFGAFTLTGTGGAEFTLDGDFTIAGAVTIGGASTTSRIFLNSDTNGTDRTINHIGAVTSVTYIDFRNIIITTATWSGTSLGNANYNSGITFPATASRYAVATGNWTSTAVWSATSGGASGASIPLCHDLVYLNAASGAITVTINTPRIGYLLDTTGFTGTLTDSGSFSSIYAVEYALVNGTISASKSFTVYAGATNANFAAVATQSIVIDTGKYRTITLVANINTTGDITVTSGYLFMNAVTVTCAHFLSSNTNTRRVDFATGFGGSTALTLTGTGVVWDMSTTTGLTLTPGFGEIHIANTSTSSKTFNGGSLTYYKLFIEGAGIATYTLTGSNTFNSFSSTKSVAHTITFTAGTTTTVDVSFSVKGSSGNVITLNSTGGTFYLSLGAGYFVNSNYLSISNSSASPSTFTWYAGANSTDGGGNSGWIFERLSWRPNNFEAPNALDTATRVNRTPLIPRFIFEVVSSSDIATGKQSTLIPRSIFESIVSADILNKSVINPLRPRSTNESVYSLDVNSRSVINPLRPRSTFETVATSDVNTRTNRTPLIPRSIFDTIVSSDVNTKLTLNPLRPRSTFEASDLADFNTRSAISPLRPRSTNENSVVEDSNTRSSINPLRPRSTFESPSILDFNFRSSINPLRPRSTYETSDSFDINTRSVVTPLRPRSTFEGILSDNPYIRTSISPLRPRLTFDSISIQDINSRSVVSPLRPRNTSEYLNIGDSNTRTVISPLYVRSVFEIINLIDTEHHSLTLLINKASMIACVDVLDTLHATLKILGIDFITSNDFSRVLESLYLRSSESLDLQEYTRQLEGLFFRSQEDISVDSFLAYLRETILISQVEGLISLDLLSLLDLITKKLCIILQEQIGSEDSGHVAINLFTRLYEALASQDSDHTTLSLYTRQVEALGLLESLQIKQSLYSLLVGESIQSVDALRNLCETILVSSVSSINISEYSRIVENPLLTTVSDSMSVFESLRVLSTLLLYAGESVDAEESASMFMYINFVISKFMGLDFEEHALKVRYFNKALESAYYADRSSSTSYKDSFCTAAFVDSSISLRYLNSTLSLGYNNYSSKSYYRQPQLLVDYRDLMFTLRSKNDHTTVGYSDRVLAETLNLKRAR